MNKNYIIAFVLLALVAVWYIAATRNSSFGNGTNGGSLADACTILTTTAVAVGTSGTNVVLATSSNRAYAIIEQPINASNTTAVLLGNGAPATLTSGIQLTPATSTSPLGSYTVGLNTATPYTGAVTALESTGASFVFVTDCRY